MTRPRATSNESDLLAATISSLKARLNDLESSTSYVGSQTNTGRNLIINGAMQVAQRSSSVASITATGYYTADRWQTQLTTLGTWTQSVQNDAPTGSGLRKSLRMLCTTADASPASGDICLIAQNFEGQNVQLIAKGTGAAKQIVLSFWVKSNLTGAYTVWLYDNDNARSVSAQYSINSSGAWEQVTVVFPADIIGVLDNDNALSLSVRFVLAAGSTYTSGTMNTIWGQYAVANVAPGQSNLAASTNNYWQITGVQLEVGATPTRFEFEPIQQTFSKCQRYYFKMTADSSLDNFGVGYNQNTTIARFFRSFPVTMRIGPTAIEQSGTANFYFVGIAGGGPGPACSSVPTFYSATTDGASFDFTTTGLTAGQGSIATAGSNFPFLAWSAEL